MTVTIYRGKDYVQSYPLGKLYATTIPDDVILHRGDDHFEQLCDLLEDDPNLAKKDEQLLIEALEHECLSCAHLLLDHDADVDFNGKYLYEDSSLPNGTALVKLLLCLENINGGCEPPNLADPFVEFHLEVMELMLKKKADPNKFSGGDNPPIHAACGCGLANHVRMLLEYKADPNIGQFRDETTPPLLGYAAEDVEQCRALVEYGANLISIADFVWEHPDEPDFNMFGYLDDKNWLQSLQFLISVGCPCGNFETDYIEDYRTELFQSVWYEEIRSLRKVKEATFQLNIVKRIPTVLT